MLSINVNVKNMNKKGFGVGFIVLQISNVFLKTAGSSKAQHKTLNYGILVKMFIQISFLKAF